MPLPLGSYGAGPYGAGPYGSGAGARPIDAGSFAEAVYAQMAPVAWDDENQGWALLIFLGALGQMFQQMDTLAHSDLGPWTSLLDIDRIPDEGVPWLGQFLGVQVDTALSVDNQRQQIREHVGWKRGTPEALRRAIQPFLTGSKTVEIVERDTSPYHFAVITYGDETPPDITFEDLWLDYATFEEFYEEWGTFEDYWLSDPRAEISDVIIALRKPAGLQFTYTITPGSPGSFKTFEALYIDYATMEDAYEAFQTFDDLYINP